MAIYVKRIFVSHYELWIRITKKHHFTNFNMVFMEEMQGRGRFWI